MDTKNRIFTIPNILSVTRILLTPPIVVSYVQEQYLLSGMFLLASGLTDLADGLIARRFNMISSLGKILDPLADKLTMVAVVLALALNHPQIQVVLMVLVIKELLMLLGTLMLFRKGKRPSESKIWGKVATALLYVILIAIMFFDFAYPLSDSVLWVLSGITCLLMITALVQYYPIFLGILSGRYNTETESFEPANCADCSSGPLDSR